MIIKCNKCGVSISVPSQSAGQMVVCPKCNSRLSVQGPLLSNGEQSNSHWKVILILLAIALAVAGGVFFMRKKSHKLDSATEKASTATASVTSSAANTDQEHGDKRTLFGIALDTCINPANSADIEKYGISNVKKESDGARQFDFVPSTYFRDFKSYSLRVDSRNHVSEIRAEIKLDKKDKRDINLSDEYNVVLKLLSAKFNLTPKEEKKDEKYPGLFSLYSKSAFMRGNGFDINMLLFFDSRGTSSLSFYMRRTAQATKADLDAL